MKGFIVTGVLSVVLATGCSKDSAPASGGGTSAVKDMSALSAAVLPKVSEENATAASRVRVMSSTYTCAQENALNGKEGFELFRLVGDPTLAATDNTCGGWGTENIFNNLDQAKLLAAAMGAAGTSATTVNTTVESMPVSVSVGPRTSVDAAVTPPLTLANRPTDITYGYGVKVDQFTLASETIPVAIRSVWKTGDAFYMMSSIHFLDKNEGDLFEGNYAESTGELRLNKAGRTPGDSGSFISRMELTGNTKTSAFNLRMLKRNTQVGSYQMSLVASGYGKGAGKFFVIKMKGCDGVDCLASATPAWYCVSATATPSDFVAFINNGGASQNQAGKIEKHADTSTLSGDCATYASDIAGTAFFGNADGPDSASNYVSDLGL